MTSCSDDDSDENDKPSIAERTLMVFMPYSGPSQNLYPYFKTNIEDMRMAIAEAKGLGHSSVIIYISSYDSKTAHLIEMKYSKGVCQLDTLKTYSSPDATTKDGISAIFNDMKINAPASEYALLVGCHGEGWLPVAGQNRVATRFIGGTSAEYQIDIPVLAEAISASNMHMEYILFDDCYLSTVEVAYDLRNSADYLIASTSEIMGYGMPYKQILPYMLRKEVGYKEICDSFYAFYSINKDPYGTLAVTELRRMDEMAQLMRAINKAHPSLPVSTTELQDLDVDHWSPTMYFDFGDYVDKLCHDDGQLYPYFTQLLSALVPYKCHTDYIYSFKNSARLRLRTFSGLSISDPSTNSYAITEKKNTAWWKATHEE